MGYGRGLGLVDDPTWAQFQAKEQRIGAVMAYLKKTKLKTTAGDRTAMFEYLKKPEIEIKDVLEYGHLPYDLSYEETRYIESEAKYEGYIRKQEREIAKAARTDSMKIPLGVDFRSVSGLTREAVERLERKRPETLGEARRIPGMTPAAVQNLSLHLEILRKRGVPAAHVSRETEPEDE